VKDAAEKERWLLPPPGTTSTSLMTKVTPELFPSLKEKLLKILIKYRQKQRSKTGVGRRLGETLS